MSEDRTGGVRITPPSDPATKEFTKRQLERGFIPPDAEEDPVMELNQDPLGILEDEKEEKNDEIDLDDHDDRLAKFLSAKPRTDPDTATLYVSSLDTTIVVRELTPREAEDVFDMFEERGLANRRNRSSINKKRLTEIQAHIVAKALVEPNLHDPNVYAKFTERFGAISLPDLLIQLIKPLELIAIGDKVMELSGGAENSVQEAKN